MSHVQKIITMIHRFFFALFSIFISACSNNTSATHSYQFHGVEYGTISDGTLEHRGSSIEGSGSLIFISPLAGISSKESYALQFTLAEGGSLSLITHSNSRLDSGLTILFSRSGSVLSGITQVGNTVSTSFNLTGIDASGTISLQIDVHNDESPAHILAWTGSNFAETAALYNSEDPGLNAAGNGAGTYWGLVLSNATVTQASVGTPQFNEGS